MQFSEERAQILKIAPGMQYITFNHDYFALPSSCIEGRFKSTLPRLRLIASLNYWICRLWREKGLIYWVIGYLRDGLIDSWTGWLIHSCLIGWFAGRSISWLVAWISGDPFPSINCTLYTPWFIDAFDSALYSDKTHDSWMTVWTIVGWQFGLLVPCFAFLIFNLGFLALVGWLFSFNVQFVPAFFESTTMSR